MPKAQARKQWVYSPKKPTISPTLKQEVEQKAQPLVQMLKEKYIQPPPMGYPFNYLTEIWTKWHRSAFYFCGTYACSSPNAISSTFEVRYARMTYAGGRNFNLAYMRHNGQWSELFTDIPLEDALDTIEQIPYFHPEQ